MHLQVHMHMHMHKSHVRVPHLSPCSYTYRSFYELVDGLALWAKPPAFSLYCDHTPLCVTPQDKMVPFDQLGIDYSPADFFDASTASYAPDL